MGYTVLLCDTLLYNFEYKVVRKQKNYYNSNSPKYQLKNGILRSGFTNPLKIYVFIHDLIYKHIFSYHS